MCLRIQQALTLSDCDHNALSSWSQSGARKREGKRELVRRFALSAYDNSLRSRGVSCVVTVPLIRNGSAAGLTRPCHSGDVREGLPAFQRVPALIDCVTVAKIGASIRISSPAD